MLKLVVIDLIDRAMAALFWEYNLYAMMNFPSLELSDRIVSRTEFLKHNPQARIKKPQAEVHNLSKQTQPEASKSPKLKSQRAPT